MESVTLTSDPASSPIPSSALCLLCDFEQVTLLLELPVETLSPHHTSSETHPLFSTSRRPSSLAWTLPQPSPGLCCHVRPRLSLLPPGGSFRKCKTGPVSPLPTALQGTHLMGVEAQVHAVHRPCMPCPPFPFMPSPPPSLTLLQLHRPRRCSSNMPGMVLPQGLCTYCSL